MKDELLKTNLGILSQLSSNLHLKTSALIYI